jgi:hypothetical protein
MYHHHKLSDLIYSNVFTQVTFYNPNLWDSKCFETLIFPELFNVITWFKIFSTNMSIWKFRFYIAECTGLITWRVLWLSNCRSHNNLPKKTKHCNTDPVAACLPAWFVTFASVCDFVWSICDADCNICEHGALC